MEKEDKKTLIIIIVLMIVLLLIGFAFRVPVPDSSNGTRDGGVVPNVLIPSSGPISTEGTLVCLPHQDTTGPQTLECAIGFLDDSGRYYGLRDTSPDLGRISQIPMDVRVAVKGTFIPGTDPKYRSVGIIEVDTITVLPPEPAPNPENPENVSGQ